jgi:hypothetical protein
MPLVPILSAFVIALLGAMAIGLRPGYSFGTLLLGATIVSAMTGLAASVLQFLPSRYFLPGAIVLGGGLGLMVGAMLGWAHALDFGAVRSTVDLVWPVAAVTGLLISRASGMQLPALRRRRRIDSPHVR